MEEISYKLVLGKAVRILEQGFILDQNFDAVHTSLSGISTVLELVKVSGIRESDYLACLFRKSATALLRCAEILNSHDVQQKILISNVECDVGAQKNKEDFDNAPSEATLTESPTSNELIRTGDRNHLVYDYKFADVVGLTSIKKVFWQTFTLPIIAPQLFTKMSTWKSILLFGPPGTGKTSTVCAAAKESKWNYFTIMPAEMFERYVGDSEKQVKMALERALKLEPCIIIIDEVDAMAPSRNENTAGHDLKFQSQFLQTLSDAAENHRIVFIGITNKPEILDAALLRRFEIKCAVSLPSKTERTLLFRKYVSMFKNDFSDRDYANLADQSPRFSGDDIKLTVKSAYVEEATNFVCMLRKKGISTQEICNQPDGTILTRKKLVAALQNRKASSTSNDTISFNNLKCKYDTGYKN